MKQQLNEQFRRMQKLAGIITESQFTEVESITIKKIEKGRDTGMTFGAIGAGYTITLSNGKTVESNDDDLLGRYSEIQNGRKSLDQLNKILVGKSWDIDENQIQEMDIDKDKEVEITKKKLRSQFEEQWKDHSQEYLDLVGTDPIYKGLDTVVNDPKVKQEIFDWAYNLTAEDEDEDALESFGGYVQDGIDYEIMQAFAPQLAENLIAAGFTYDKDEDIWTLPQSYLDKTDGMFDYSNGATSYGIIWDVWNMDYDTSPREVISDYLKDAAEKL